MENAKIETTTTENKPIESAALDLMLSDEAVSSQQQNVTDIVNRAASVRDQGRRSAEASRDAQLAGIEGTFGREQRTLDLNIQNARSAFAQGSSMGTSTAQFKVLNDTINKNLGDIKSRKEEARLNADAAFEAQLTNLEMNYLEQQQQATQQAFSNMLGIAGLSQQAQTIQLQERAQDFAQKQAVGNIALQYGLEVEDGDTLESLLNKAAPIVTADRTLDQEEQKARMDQIRQSIKTAQAQEATARANAASVRQRMAENKTLADMDQDALAELVAKGYIDPTKAIGLGASPSKIISADKAQKVQLASQDIEQLVAMGENKENIIDTVKVSNPELSRVEISALLNGYDFTSTENQPQASNLPQILKNIGEGGIKAREDINYFLSGTRPN